MDESHCVSNPLAESVENTNYEILIMFLINGMFVAFN